MNHAFTPRAQTPGEAPWLSPLEAFVAWLASFLRTIAGLKRRTVFPPNWKGHWEGLRELEWYRDQILAFSAKHVLSGGSLDDRTDFQLILDVPAGYGVCPRTAYAMNRRFIAMAQFRLEPDKYIQRHIRRIAQREGITLVRDMRRAPLRHATKTSRASTQCVDPAGSAGGGIAVMLPTPAEPGEVARSAGGGSHTGIPAKNEGNSLYKSGGNRLT